MTKPTKLPDADSFISLLGNVRDKFESQGPVYSDNSEKVLFVGDVHGDLETVRKVKRRLKSYDRIVFLGDYVDRGQQDTEVVIALANIFLADPKIVLLAGNHDAYNKIKPRDWPTRLEMQYGKSGARIEQAYLEAFERAPIAYLHENYKILALHAFIPKSKRHWDISKWKKVESGDSHEILWNDPADRKGIHISERGEGKWAIGPDITKDFMARNCLNYIVRSHEPEINRIKTISGKRKLVNIGSSMHYGKRCFFSMPKGKIIDASGD